MSNYLLKRLFFNLLTFFVLSFVIFQIMALMPGDPLDLMIQSNPNMTSEDLQRLKRIYGLDQPGYVRYFNWFGEAIRGDFGYSRTFKVPVTDVVGSPIFNTFLLGGLSLLLSLFVAIPLGTLAAVKRGKVIDRIIRGFAFTGTSVPSFWLALLLILCFAVSLELFPAGGYQTIGAAEGSFFDVALDRLKYLILPVVSLSFAQTGLFLKFTRNSLVEVIEKDFIRTAKAKGLSLKAIVLKHGLRNALIPLVTIVSLSIGTMFSGAVITETVFSYPGLGRLIFNSVLENDFNVAMFALMIVVFMVLFGNFLADILYFKLDPRIERPGS